MVSKYELEREIVGLKLELENTRGMLEGRIECDLWDAMKDWTAYSGAAGIWDWVGAIEVVVSKGKYTLDEVLTYFGLKENVSG